MYIFGSEIEWVPLDNLDLLTYFLIVEFQSPNTKNTFLLEELNYIYKIEKYLQFAIRIEYCHLQT